MSDTKVPFPNPTLHAGQRLVVSGYARAQVADYGDKRAAERDSFWQSEAGNAAPTQGAEGAAPQAVVREASEAVGAQIEALTALADTYVDAGITYQGNPNALTVAALDAARSAFINAARAALAQHQPATLRETK